MKTAAEYGMLIAYVVFMYVALPVGIILGWRRWLKRRESITSLTAVSLVAFSLATCSVLLALASLIYAYVIGGFPFYDPRLMRIYRWGLLLSLGGIVLGLIGCRRRSPVRWLAPVCAAAIFIYWVVAAVGE